MSEAVEFEYTPRQEFVNAATHGVGAALSIAGLCFMVVYAAGLGDAYRVVSVSVFGGAMVLLYLASTLYHAIPHTPTKNAFRMVDHVSIYLLIAGTYTPFTLVSMRGSWGWTLFGFTWGLAVIGIVFKLFFRGRYSNMTVLTYVAMGWVCVIAAKPVIAAVPGGALIWLAIGGLLYTGGVGFYLWEKLPYHHGIWHLFVMSGTFCHFVSVYWYVLPPVVSGH